MRFRSALAIAGTVTLMQQLLPTPGQAQSQDQVTIGYFGDFRLRTQVDRDRAGGGVDRTRVRMRARFGIDVDLLHNVHFITRVATFSDETNPNSGHVTLGEGFRNLQLDLDRAYLEWTVPTERNLRVFLGKFPNPVTSTFPFSEILWDKDIAPEGIAATFQPLDAVTLVFGEYLVLQRAPGRTINLTSAQIRVGGRLAENLTATTAVSTYLHSRPDAGAAAFLAIEDEGNVLAFDGSGNVVDYASDFQIYHVWTAGRYTGAAIPIGVSAQYIRNAGAAPGFDNDGWAAGLELGHLGPVGSWRLNYQYQEIGQEAVFSTFAHDELPDATNYRGHYATASLRVHPRITATGKAFLSARQVPRIDTLEKRFRLDIDVVF